MSAPVPLHIRAEGQILNAAVCLTEHAHYIDVILESRSGARGSARERNPDYLVALTVILEELCALAACIDDMQIVSRPALVLPEQDRRLPFSFPVQLSPQTNFVALRSRVSESQRGVARGSNRSGKGGGNNNKRLLLRVRRDAAVRNLTVLTERLLGAGCS